MITINKSSALFGAFLALFFFSSCQKELPDDSLDYIGSWGSDKYAMEIWKNGRGVLEWGQRGPYECRVIIEDKTVKFRGGIRRNFSVDDSPYLDADGYWRMTLNGEDFLLH